MSEPGDEDRYSIVGVNEDDFAVPHYELEDEVMAPATRFNDAEDDSQNGPEITLVRVFLGKTFKGASESSFLTLRCTPGASVQSVKIQAMNKLKTRYPEGNFEPQAYVMSSAPMPGLPQKRTQECSDRDLAVPEFVPFLEHFESACISEVNGHKVLYMRLEPRDKQPETSASRGATPSTSPSISKVRLVRVAFREVDNGVTPGQGFLTLKCADDTTARHIKLQALAKYNAKRVGGSPKTQSRNSQNLEDDMEIENYTLSLISIPKDHSRSESKTADGKSTAIIKDDDRLASLFPKTSMTTPQILEVLLSRRSTEHSLSRSRASMVREDSRLREDSMRRGSLQDDALMRYVIAGTPDEAGREDSVRREDEAVGDCVLLRIKFLATGGITEGFVTVKCEESATVNSIKEQALVKFARRSSSGSMPTAKLDPHLFTLWKMEPTAISDEGVNGNESLWKLFRIQKTTAPIQVQMVYSNTRKEEADPFIERPNAQVFLRHGVEEKGTQLEVWYTAASGGRLGWGRQMADSVLLADVKEIYLGSFWFPEQFVGSNHARRCFVIEWSDSRGPGWLCLEASSSDLLRKWIEGLYHLLMIKKNDGQGGLHHQQCTLYYPVQAKR